MSDGRIALFWGASAAAFCWSTAEIAYRSAAARARGIAAAISDHGTARGDVPPPRRSGPIGPIPTA